MKYNKMIATILSLGFLLITQTDSAAAYDVDDTDIDHRAEEFEASVSIDQNRKPNSKTQFTQEERSEYQRGLRAPLEDLESLGLAGIQLPDLDAPYRERHRPGTISHCVDNCQADYGCDSAWTAWTPYCVGVSASCLAFCIADGGAY